MQYRRPVTITLPADQTNNEGDTPSLSISASGGTLSYAALGLPPGLKINPSTGAITGTVAIGDAADGPYWVTVIAGDGTYSASQSFNWNVNTTITVAVPDTLSNNDGDSVSQTVSATESGSPTFTYSAQDLPPGLGINPSTAAITGTIAVGDSSIGSFFPTLLVTDGTYTAVASFEWDIGGAISITDAGDQLNTVGDAVTVQISAVDTGAGTLYYAAAGLPAGLSINTSTGLITGTITSGAASIGSYITTVVASDGTNAAVDTFNWTVTAAGTLTLATPSNQTSAEAATPSLSLSASYSGGGTLHYFAEDLPPGLKINPSTGAITGTVAVGDSGYGPYTVTAIVTDGAISTEETFTWTINGPVTITPPADQLNSEGDTPTLTISASDSSAGTLKYTAVGLPFGLHISTSTGVITGTVAVDAAAAGQYTVLVTAGDGTYSASQAFTWNVGGLVTVASVAAEINNEGDTPSLTISAADTSAGTLVYAATGLPAGLSINRSTGAIGGTIAAGAAAFGPYTVVVTAGDGTYSASTTFSWNVNNPITIITPSTEVFSVGSAVNFVVGVTDSLVGTVVYSAYNLPAGLSINASTGDISGTIGSSVAAVGSFASEVVATIGTYSNNAFIYWRVAGFGLINVGVLATVKSHLVVDGARVDSTSEVYKAVLARYRGSRDTQALVQEMLDTMIGSPVANSDYVFDKVQDLQNAVRLRYQVIQAAALLQTKIDNGTMTFSTGNNGKIVLAAKGEPLFEPQSLQVKVITDGRGGVKEGVKLKAGATPSEGIVELIDPKEQVASDCASAAAIIFQYALFKYYGAKGYDGLFDDDSKQWSIVANYHDATGNWPLRFVNFFEPDDAIKHPDTFKKADLLPGDMRVFYNPDVKLGKGNYRYENTIYLGDDKYFAFPFGVVTKKQILDDLAAVSNNPETIRDLGGSDILKPGP